MENQSVHTENTGTVASGDVYIDGQYAAGRDITIIESNYAAETEWISVNLSAYSSTIAPVFTEQLVQQLKETGLLILAGGVGFDKEEFAKHLAWRISQNYSLPAIERTSPDIQPKELFAKIKQHETNAIFLLSELAPKDIAFSIEKLSDCRQAGHFVIVTTNWGTNTWQLQPFHEKKYWFEIPSSGLFEPHMISSILINNLNICLPDLSFEHNIRTFSAETNLLSYEPLSVTAKSFQTPEQVALFTELLRIEKQPITDVAIQALLKSFSNTNEALVSKWFRNLNNDREKLLVIAAALLDGIYEDQFFEILKEIVDAFWHYRDPSLYALDYGDLDFLGNFFRFDDTFGRGSVIKGRFPFQRADILRCAWQTHRRHITSAIPILNSIAQQSRYNRNMKKGLYSSRQRRMQLREVVAETFSDIGILYLPAVEENLLRLAATGDDSLHRIIAKALVRWKFLDKEDQLYALIWKWLGNEEASEQISDILQEDNAEKATDGRAKRYLNKVVIMALEYIVESEPPNQLSPRIIELIQYFINERPEIAIELYSGLVSKLLASHFDQIKPLFSPEFINEKSKSIFIAEGMLSAYKEQPLKVKEWIEEWMNLCLEEKFAHNLLLKTILYVYNRLLDDDQMEDDQVWEKIRALYLLRRNEADNTLFLKIIKHLLAKDFESNLNHIKFLFEYSNFEERQILIGCFTSIYKDQRAKLEGPTAYLILDEKRYPYWPNAIRPLTEIEEVMYKWMHGQNAFSRDIALLSLAAFAILFDKRELSTTPILNPVKSSQPVQQSTYNENSSFYGPRRLTVLLTPPYFSLYSRILIFFWLLFESKENKVVIRQYIVTLLQYPFVADPIGKSVLIRNLREKNTRLTVRIARLLERVYRLA